MEMGKAGIQEESQVTTYQVHAVGIPHDIEAHTYVQDSNGLRFIGADGVVVAIFTSFDWMKVVKPVEQTPTV
jgi:hypothetical protein